MRFAEAGLFRQGPSFKSSPRPLVSSPSPDVQDSSASPSPARSGSSPTQVRVQGLESPFMVAREGLTILFFQTS